MKNIKVDIAITLSVLGAYFYFVGHIYHGAYFSYFKLAFDTLGLSVDAEKQVTVGMGIFFFILIDYWYYTLIALALFGAVFKFKDLILEKLPKAVANTVAGLLAIIWLAVLTPLIVGYIGAENADHLTRKQGDYVNVVFDENIPKEHMQLKVIKCDSNYCAFYNDIDGEVFLVNTSKIIKITKGS